MNNVHDMGGMQGYGPIQIDDSSIVFHHDWERRAFALTVVTNTAGQWNIDRSRSIRESLPPLKYLSNTYYQIWLDALETQLLKTGMLSRDELESGQAKGPGLPGVKALDAHQLPAALNKGWPSQRPTTAPARFAIGQHVRTIQSNPRTHTRLPGYCRDKQGVITALHGMHVFPDKSAIGPDEPQWLYTVEFAAREIWGAETSASSVSLNCWEPYLLEVIDAGN
ncbi:nitrile hydratase subunit beta [Orrella daihaiensis]|uniref:Nitrile hydratase subunit beta n=1 Tax=Orrella daihaiensis TaxID=2782176 RepID=A0ABY4AHL3_9BURK|nr:nitrile hydratase subunit beta [Orrella daihaiensis]UOD49398.1 nitrile hydratase subunit beta [Orrella daihaiensis]